MTAETSADSQRPIAALFSPGPGTRDLPADLPIALLAAPHQVVPFIGRGELLASLQAFCDDDGDVRAQLLHAPGGSGKTRLAIELCHRLRQSGWRAGFAAGGARIADLLDSDDPVLAVIDGIESVPELADMLRSVAGKRSRSRLRLLLLARTAADWWSHLLSETGPVADLLGAEDPIALGSLEEPREVVFHEAARAFARRLGVRAEVEAPDLADPRYARVLYVHMAALAALERKAIDPDTLLDTTLEQELDRWLGLLGKAAPAPKRAATRRQLQLLMAALTLTGGAQTAAEARSLVSIVPGGSGEPLVDLLHGARGGILSIAAMQPALLGEAMVRRLIHDPHLPHHCVDRIFERADARAVQTGFTVLARVLVDEAGAEAWIERMLCADLSQRAPAALAAATLVDEDEGLALASVLAGELRRGRPDLVERIAAALPHPDSTRTLDEVGAWAAKRWSPPRPGRDPMDVSLETAPTADDALRARLSRKLGAWKRAAGRREDALVSLLDAERRHRLLAAAEPAFSLDLAATLHELAGAQADLDQATAARASLEEAVALRRAHAAPPADLAASLEQLARVGARDAALAAAEEAVRIRRELAAAPPGSPHRPASPYRRAPRNAGSRAAARAKKKKPAEPLSDLAWSLCTLSKAQLAAARDAAALASIEEAVAISRRLPDELFAPMLDSLRERLAQCGRAPSTELLERIQVSEAKRAAVRDDAEDAEARADAGGRELDWIVSEKVYDGDLPDAAHAQLTALIAEELADRGRARSSPGALRWSPSAGSRDDRQKLMITVRSGTATPSGAPARSGGKTRVLIRERRRSTFRYDLLAFVAILALWRDWIPWPATLLSMLLASWVHIAERLRAARIEELQSLLGEAVQKAIARAAGRAPSLPRPGAETRMRIAMAGAGPSEPGDEDSQLAREAAVEDDTAAETEVAEQERPRAPRSAGW